MGDLRPNFILTPPDFIADGEGEGDVVVEGDDASCKVDNGDKFSSPNCESCTIGLETLQGGDPQKNGGDDAISFVMRFPSPWTSF